MRTGGWGDTPRVPPIRIHLTRGSDPGEHRTGTSNARGSRHGDRVPRPPNRRTRRRPCARGHRNRSCARGVPPCSGNGSRGLSRPRRHREWWWAACENLVAAEHLLTEAAARRANGPIAVVAGPEDERHARDALALSVLMTQDGWRVNDIGAGTSLDEADALIEMHDTCACLAVYTIPDSAANRAAVAIRPLLHGRDGVGPIPYRGRGAATERARATRGILSTRAPYGPRTQGAPGEPGRTHRRARPPRAPRRQPRTCTSSRYRPRAPASCGAALPTRGCPPRRPRVPRP